MPRSRVEIWGYIKGDDRPVYRSITFLSNTKHVGTWWAPYPNRKWEPLPDSKKSKFVYRFRKES